LRNAPHLGFSAARGPSSATANASGGQAGSARCQLHVRKNDAERPSAEIMNKIEEYKKEKDGLDVGRRRLKSKQV
jgi:hypothetical protein